jgi:hypothetical protein
VVAVGGGGMYNCCTLALQSGVDRLRVEHCITLLGQFGTFVVGCKYVVHFLPGNLSLSGPLRGKLGSSPIDHTDGYLLIEHWSNPLYGLMDHVIDND